MSKNEKQLMLRRLTIFLILATVFEFSNLGAMFLADVGLPQLITK